MSKRFVRWLYDELPELVEKGVLSPESAEKLQQHYGEVKVREGRQLAIVIFSVLGAMLIGLGIILMFAHNWDKLSRSVRTAASIAPLILGQIASGMTILQRRDSPAWREGSSTFLVIAIGASTALVAQIYNITGDFGDYLITWILLSIPLVYLMNAMMPALLSIILITVWAGYSRLSGGEVLLYIPLIALIIPRLWSAMRENRYGVRTALILWFLSFSVCYATGAVLGRAENSLWIVNYSSAFTLMYLAGKYWFDDALKRWQMPLCTVGGMGILIMAFILSFKALWEELARGGFSWGEPAPAKWEYYTDITISTALAVLALSFLFKSRIFRTYGCLFGIFPLVSGLSYAFTVKSAAPAFSIFVFNAYLAALGIAILAAGLREGNLRIVNVGMLIVMALIIARFFDIEINFLVRGITFIVCGIAFLLTNVMLIRRRKGSTQ